jgi:hypothetical protein
VIRTRQIFNQANAVRLHFVTPKYWIRILGQQKQGRYSPPIAAEIGGNNDGGDFLCGVGYRDMMHPEGTAARGQAG